MSFTIISSLPLTLSYFKKLKRPSYQKQNINKTMEICHLHHRKALTEANVLLRMKHGMVRLDSVWGVAGGRRPVKLLVKKVSQHKTMFISMLFKKPDYCFSFEV